MQRRCDRNRKRSKRRSIYCPIHECHLDSVSQKYQMFADSPGQLQQRGISRRVASILVATKTTVSIDGEWLEAFWCEQCQETKWYHVRKCRKLTTGQSESYQIALAPRELWQQVAGVTHPEGNPTVGEFTKRNARMLSYNNIKDFKF